MRGAGSAARSATGFAGSGSWWPSNAIRNRGDDLVVIADTGEMWSGDSAWLIVLWALADYRHWSYRLASPLLLPTARAAFAKLSAYRGTLSCGLGLSGEAG
jgi:hypothetical protein